MKKIYIFRHAKSSWADVGMRDFDRPLNARGKRDAPLMGKLLRNRGIVPDFVVSSPANRAQTTARLVAAEVGFPLENIVLDASIYEASMEEVLSAIQSLPEGVNTVFLFGHNPALTYLANYFNPEELVMNVPTCGVITVLSEVQNWWMIGDKTAKIVGFDYPKLHGFL